MKLIVHTDGGARGNPGPAAVGVVIEEAISGQQSAISQKRTSNEKLDAERCKLIAEYGKTIGEATNNVAEYTAVIEALEKIKNQKSLRKDSGQAKIKDSNENLKLEIHFLLDSTLVVNQLNGLFKIKDVHLRQLVTNVHILEQEVGGVITYTAVPREQNTRADALVNQALDGNR